MEKVKLFKTVLTDDFGDLYDIKKIKLGLSRHLFLICCCSMVFGLVGLYMTYRLLNTYVAESIFVYSEDRNASRDIPGGYSLNTPSLATTIDMIMMTKNFEAVKTILGLNLEPSEIMSMVTIPQSSSESKLRRIEVRSKNPNLAVDIANTLAKVVVKKNQEFTREQLKVALDIYQAQLAIVNMALNKQNLKIEEFKKENQYFETDANYMSALADMDNTRRLLSSVDLNYQGLLVEYENLKKEAQLIPDRVPINREARDSPYKTRIITLETALAQAKSKYTPENPKIIALEQELKELLKKMQGATDENSPDEFVEKNPVKETIGIELMHLQGKVRSAKKTRDELALQVAEMEKKLQKVPEQQLELGKMLHAKQLTEDQVKFLTTAIDTTKLLINAPNGSIELYTLAKEAKPSNAKWWVHLMTVFGLIFGACTGLFFALVAEFTDRYLRTSKQLSLSYTVPCILSIPEMRSLTLANGYDKTEFYMRELVDKLSLNGEHRSIAITSSKENEGKSFLSFFLAQYYRGRNKKVLIISFDDTFNPFNTAVPCSIEEFLKNPIQDHIRIQSPPLQNVWKTLESRYDMILIDAPGVVSSAFSVNILALADTVLFVIGSSTTDKKIVDDSLHVLETFGVAPSGLVLNRIDNHYIDNERIKSEMKRNGN